MNIDRSNETFRLLELLREEQDEVRHTYMEAQESKDKEAISYYKGKIDGYEETIYHVTNCTPIFKRLVGMGDPFERKHEVEQQLYFLDVLKNRIKLRMIDKDTDGSAEKAYIGILATIDNLMTKGESLL